MFKLSSLQKARIILIINALVLFFFIITTPYFIRSGFWGIPEWLAESFFLTVEITLLIKTFRKYDRQNRQAEDKLDSLSLKLKEQEKTLLNSLEYLGKVNVQMSIIKKLMGKLRPPSDDNRLDNLLLEMLQGIMSLAGQKEIGLRIVDSRRQRTIKELVWPERAELQKKLKKIRIKDLLNASGSYLNQVQKKFDLKLVLANYDNFALQTVVFLPVGNLNGKKNKEMEQDKERQELIQGLVNQCEIVFLLSSSKYYQRQRGS